VSGAAISRGDDTLLGRSPREIPTDENATSVNEELRTVLSSRGKDGGSGMNLNDSANGDRLQGFVACLQYNGFGPCEVEITGRFSARAKILAGFAGWGGVNVEDFAGRRPLPDKRAIPQNEKQVFHGCSSSRVRVSR
jgi:hypothetical protein